MASQDGEREPSKQDRRRYRHPHACLTGFSPLRPIWALCSLETVLFGDFSSFPAPELSHPGRIGFPRHQGCEENVMLSWVVTFLIIALVAGLLGFGGIAGASIEIAKIVFFIAIALFVVSALVSLMRGRGSV
jgi:uncharacterized membrane protein YtjA (UPF0391 family)